MPSLGPVARAGEAPTAASHGGALGLATPGAQGRTMSGQGEDMATAPDVQAALAGRGHGLAVALVPWAHRLVVYIVLYAQNFYIYLLGIFIVFFKKN